MKEKIKKALTPKKGSVLILVMISLLILTTLGTGILSVSSHVRHSSQVTKNEAVAMLAAEAGYERAIFNISKQKDVLSAIQKNLKGMSGKVEVTNGYTDYTIGLHTFVGSRPVYKITSSGHSGEFNRTVEVLVVQAASGWEMGKCRVPTGLNSTAPVYFASGEVINIPLQINKLGDSPDKKDIYISGQPKFLKNVGMSESRYKRNYDKYSGVMGHFQGGIYFDQPNNRITDKDSIDSKIERFKDSTNSRFIFKPVDKTKPGSVTKSMPAVQLEFYSSRSGVGKVRITNNCTVRGYQRSRSYDYKINNSGGSEYKKYDIYAYHLRRKRERRVIRRITSTYVTQSFGSAESAPGGQIFVEGNVIIGGDLRRYNDDNQEIAGKITVVATGNIWVADSITVYDKRGKLRDADGMPSEDNPNALGLIAGGVIKVVDPGLIDNVDGGRPVVPRGFKYVAIGQRDGSDRKLPANMIVEAGVTVGGGGWGAENVGQRKNTNKTWQSWGRGRGRRWGRWVETNDNLILRGTLTEAIRGIVGSGTNGYIKKYYLDARLTQGILPGDIWLAGKFVPAPAGWKDYRPNL